MEENKTTIFNSNITRAPKKVLLPEIGDTLNICVSEDVAYEAYNKYLEGRDKANEPIKEEYLTDFFKLKEVEGTLCEPLYVNGKIFGFVGCRCGLGKKVILGEFYLYEME